MQKNIYKAAGILIRDRRVLIVRAKGKTSYISPGGKLERGELPSQALIRELHEELSLSVSKQDLEHFGSFRAPAAYEESCVLHMDVFIVQNWEGDISPANEIEEILWMTAQLPEGVQLSSIFNREVLPELKRRDLID